MFCFKCGASMPETATVCPQCATPVSNAPASPASSPAAPPPPVSAWLNVPAAQTQYPQTPPYPSPVQPYGQAQTDGQAVASLVLGIASLFLCLSVLAGIPAIILGHISWSRIRRSMGRLKGEGMALAGLIMGYISIPWILIIAAIAIPNLMRSRIAANEAVAASTLRTINTSQVTYITSYPDRGYAPDLATLGPGQGGSCASEGNADHACLLDNIVANANCTAGAWCTKYAYRYSLRREGDCGQQPGSHEGSGAECTYVVVASPLNYNTGTKNLCSTSDGILHFRYGAPLTTPITAEQCLEWARME
jgi:type II secretory pathway pseudopilin PulG